MNRLYTGQRQERGTAVSILENGKRRSLPMRLDVRCHAPDGFEWGYGGSGPSQLALALLCDALGDVPRALRLYHHFKFEYVATIQKNTWEMDAQWVRDRAALIEAKARA